MYFASAFGLTWASDQPLRYFRPASGSSQTAEVSLRTVEVLAPRSDGRPLNRGTVYPDGLRFTWDDIAVFDLRDGETIDVLPLPGWRGELPWPFFSTVTALLLAWRGALPLHASAVSIADRAILLCGASGAGKSTLCAALLAQGAKLLSDDLTVLRDNGPGLCPDVLPGRPGIRLLPEIAASFGGAVSSPIAGDHRHKVMAEWPDALADRPVRLAATILLQEAPVPTGPVERLICLRGQRFRPRWLDALPLAENRFAALAHLAHSTALLAVKPLGPFSPLIAELRARELLDLASQL